MDKPSIESILENSDYVLNLANALETNNEELKKQIFELLCALSTHSQQGYKRAIDTLEILKVSKFIIFFFIKMTLFNFSS